MSPLAVVQQIYTRYKAIADDTLYLGDGRPRAIFEVHPPNLALADADTLESTAQQLAVVFNSLSFAFQLLFRLVAVDLEDHAAEAELAAARRDPELAAAGRDYAALLRHLSRTLVLLEPHVFLVVGLEGGYGSLLRSSLRAIVTWLLRLLHGRARPAVAGPTDTEQLDQRGEQIALQFAAIGARPRAAGQRRDRRAAVHVLVSRTRSSSAAPDSAEDCLMPLLSIRRWPRIPKPPARLTDAPFFRARCSTGSRPPTSNSDATHSSS